MNETEQKYELSLETIKNLTDLTFSLATENTELKKLLEEMENGNSKENIGDNSPEQA